jgi:hypothetical protein
MSPTLTQAQVKAIGIAFYRAARASALANGIQIGFATRALQDLGTGGV